MEPRARILRYNVMRNLKFHQVKCFFFFLFFMFSVLSGRSRSIFRWQRQTDYQQCPKRGLGTPKSHTRKKRLLYTADFRVIYTSYLFSETTNCVCCNVSRRPWLMSDDNSTSLNAHLLLATFALAILLCSLINELFPLSNKQLTFKPTFLRWNAVASVLVDISFLFPRPSEDKVDIRELRMLLQSKEVV